MLKKIMIIVVFIICLIIPANSLAITNNSLKKDINELQTNNYKLDKNFFLNEQPYQLVSIDNEDYKNPLLWVWSIFIPGLGQMMMGDVARGIKFTIIGILSMGLNFYLLAKPVLTPTGIPNATWLEVFALNIILFITNYILNIVDAISMSHGLNKKNELQQDDLLRKSELLERIKLVNKSINFEIYNF